MTTKKHEAESMGNESNAALTSILTEVPAFGGVLDRMKAVCVCVCGGGGSGRKCHDIQAGNIVMTQFFDRS